MASQLDIYNFALGNVGNSYEVGSLTEDSNERRVCARFFDMVHDMVLSECPWPFSTKTQALSVSSEDAPIGWTYRYTYPSDCAKAWLIVDEGGIRDATVNVFTSFISQDFFRQDFIPFEVMHGDDQTSIVCDLDEAYLIYASNATPISRYSANLVNALSWGLAFYIAGPLGSIPLNERQGYFQNFQFALAEAKAHAFNESKQDPSPSTPSILARQ